MAGTYTYAYTGNQFNQALDEDTSTFGLLPSGSFTANDFVTVSFTLSAPLQPNTYNNHLLSSIVAYSASSGVIALDNTDSSIQLIALQTDASGAIVDWGFNIWGDGIGQVDSNYHTYTPAGFNFDEGCIAGSSICGESQNNPGVWTLPDSDLSAPEPSSLFLLGSGMLGLAAIRRRRAAHSY